VDRVEILQAKWLGAVLRSRYLTLSLFGVLVLGILTGGLHPLAAVLVALAVAFHVAFFASFGLWLSVVCRSVLVANCWMAVIVFFLVGVSGVVRVFFLPWGNNWVSQFWQVGLNPVGCWTGLAFTREELAELAEPFVGVWRLMPALCGIAFYGPAIWVCWILAHRCFGARSQRVAALGTKLTNP
jgi:hypothetical protein